MSKDTELESETPNEPKALRLPYFPSSTPLANPRHYAGGIPIRALEGNLLCIIRAWYLMALGDRIEVFWHSLTSPAVFKTIEFDEEVDEDVVLWIPRDQVLEGDATPVFYQIRQGTQTPERSYPLETYLVKTTRPGGDDNSPEQGHSGLKYTLVPNVSGGVDPAMADAGIEMHIQPYEHMTRDDRVVARWGSQDVSNHLVTQAQVDDPVNNPIIITFTRAVIEAAGDGEHIVVTFQIVDCVGNYPVEQARWAKYTYVLVDLRNNRLVAPRVLMNGRPTDTIDLDQLGDDDVGVRLYTPDSDFAVNDKVQVTWTGTPAQGSPIVVRPLEQTVEFVGFQLDFTIPNAAVKAIAQGYATVSYVRIRSGEADRPSKNASVSVLGDINRLPAPSVAQAPGGTLPADAPYATISVAYFEGRKTGDLITVHCQGRRPGGSETYYPISIIVADSDGQSAITRDLPGREIAPLEGGTLKIYYVVANDDRGVRSERESLALNLNVGVALPDFNQPEITEADGDVLLPENTPNGANVIAPFNVPGDTLAGDIVGLRWTGSVTGAHPLYEIPLTTQTAGRPVPFLVRAEHIHPNVNGTVDVDYYRKRGTEPTRFSHKRRFSIGNALPDWAAPSIAQATGQSLDPMAAKDALTVVIPGTLQPDDLLSVTWSGAAGDGSYTSEAKPVREIGQNIEIPVMLGAHNLGKAVTVSYSVSRGGDPAKSSLPLVLNVQRIADEHPGFPTPRISRAQGNELDVTQLVGTDTLLIDRWPFPAVGQHVYLTLSCPGADGTDVPLVIWTGQAHNYEPGITLSLQNYLDWLKGRRDGATLRIVFMVNLDKVANEATAVKFPVQTYTVRTIITEAPEITLVTDSKGVVPLDGYTFDNSMTIVGTCSPSQRIRLLDDTTSWGDISADGSGIWSHPRNNLTVNNYSLTARALYGSEPVSEPPRRFQVKDPLSIVPTQMDLNGFSVKIPTWTKTGLDSLGNTDTRVPTGGTPPYSYASSDPAVASVTAAGKVTGNKNGSAVIYVTDRDGTSVSYRVAVTNIYELQISSTAMKCVDTLTWMTSLRGQTAYNQTFLGDIARVYVPPARPDSVWLCHMTSSAWGIYLNPNGGILGGQFINNPYIAWCLVPL